MCETAIQAAFTNIGPGIYPVRRHVVHRYHHTFLDSVIKGCFLCRRACRVEHWPQDPPSQIPTGFDLLDSYRSEWEERLLPFPTDPPMECLRASVSSITQKTLPKELDRLVRLLKSWDCESPFLQCCMYWGTNEKECRVDIFNIPPQDRMDLARDSESETEDLESEIEYVYTSVLLCPAVAATKEPTPLSGNKFSRHGGDSTSDCSELWGHWLHVCSEKHDQCRTPHGDTRGKAFFPARIVEVFPNEDKTAALKWRLTTRNEVAPAPYLTLSHCWGPGVPANARLADKTFSSFFQEHLVTTLPKTFQDAMRITVSLGFQYLWIDSLCIIQDNTTDWKEQSSVMGLVYKHADCNIAATWAKDGSQGCFSQRDPAIIAPAAISLRGPSRDRDEALAFEMAIGDPEMYRDNLGSAPLNGRGWVLQERYLARRQLNFAKDAVYWECKQLVASEQFPDGLPKNLQLGFLSDFITGEKPRIDFASESEVRRYWVHLVQEYSTTELTYDTDRMIAIAGLVSEVKDRFDDVYLAGMWREDLHKQLCWTAQFRRSPSAAGPSATKPYIAPSWSWAGSDASIQADKRHLKDDDPTTTYFLEILDATARAKHPSGLYDFDRDFGTLKIQGIVMWARFRQMGRIRHKLMPPIEHVPGPVFEAIHVPGTRKYGTDFSLYINWDGLFGIGKGHPRLDTFHKSD